jgi:hypothetical protein
MAILLGLLMTIGPAWAGHVSEVKTTRQAVALTWGMQSTLDLDFVPCAVTEECIRVANKRMLQIQYSKDKRQLILTPIERGETTVTIRDGRGDVKLVLHAIVNANNLSRRVSELRELLKDIKGIQIRIVSDKIVVDGEVSSVSDLNRYYAVLSDESYKGVVLNLVGVSESGMWSLASKIEKEIARPAVHVKVVNSFFVVEGMVRNGYEADQVLAVARSMIPAFIIPTYNLEGPRSPFEVRKAKVVDPVLSRLTLMPPRPRTFPYRSWPSAVAWFLAAIAGALVLVLGIRALVRKSKFSHGYGDLVRSGKRAVTLPVTDGVPIGRNLVRPGERIDVLATYDTASGARVTRAVAENLFVFGFGKAEACETVTVECDPMTAARLRALKDAGAVISIMLRGSTDHGRSKVDSMTFEEAVRQEAAPEPVSPLKAAVG